MKQFSKISALACRLLLVLFLALGSAGTGLAQKQGQARIDSLEGELQKKTEDTGKVLLLDMLSYEESNYNADAALKYGEEGLALAEKLEWQKGIAQSYNSIGTSYLSLSKTDMAMEYFEKALKINEASGSKLRAAQNLGNIALLCDMKSDLPKALEYLFRALKIFEELKDDNGVAIQLGNIASIYDEGKNFPKAIAYDSMALLQYSKLNDKDGVAMILGNLANAYDDMGRHDKAMQYDNDAIKIYEELGNKAGIARNLGNLSVLYESKKDYYKAMEMAFKALSLDKETGDQRSMAKALANIGSYYLDIFNDPLPLKKDSMVPGNKNACLKLAVDYVQKAITIDAAINELNSLANDYLVLARSQRAAGDYKNAIESFIKHYQLNDSVFSLDSKVKIENLTTEREMGLKNKQLEIDKLEVEKKRNERFFFIAGIGALLIVIFFVYRNFKTERKSNELLSVSNKLLSSEKQKTEDLLLNILPSEVAEELKQTGASAARHFDNVSVIFTDFVDFTGAGEHMSPQELIDELHACFKAFDEITGKYKIEKIKTIGDAYLAVAGLPLADPLHAEHIVNAAIEINEFMMERQIKMGNRTFGIRIGIHSGSVVAGIVGVKKFAYDIWGDTVNTAARMEQNSEPGRINISETTYELVRNKFACEYRGEIEAKGKGMLKMYYVSA